jgi:hypothetical protein
MDLNIHFPYVFMAYCLITWAQRQLHWTTKGSDVESQWGKEFSLLHVVQTGSGAHQSSYPPIQWVPGAISPVVKRPGLEADYQPPTSAEIKKTWVYTSTPPYFFMAYCLIS